MIQVGRPVAASRGPVVRFLSLTYDFDRCTLIPDAAAELTRRNEGPNERNPAPLGPTVGRTPRLDAAPLPLAGRPDRSRVRGNPQVDLPLGQSRNTIFAW